MAATLHIMATLLVLSALYSARPIQPVSIPPIHPLFSIFPYTMSTTASGSSFPAPTGSNPIAYSTDLAIRTRRLTPRTNPMTQPSMAPATAANATTSTQDQSSWNSGVISTVVFGCIASILGALAFWATIWLGRRRTSFAARNNTDTHQAPEPELILEGIQIGIPPSRDTNTNSTSVRKPPEPPHHPRDIVPQDIHAPACATSVIDSHPPAYVPPNVGV